LGRNHVEIGLGLDEKESRDRKKKLVLLMSVKVIATIFRVIHHPKGACKRAFDPE